MDHRNYPRKGKTKINNKSQIILKAQRSTLHQPGLHLSIKNLTLDGHDRDLLTKETIPTIDKHKGIQNVSICDADDK